MMKRFILFLMMVALLAACGGSPEPTPIPVEAVGDPIRIVALGDSLTEGLGVDPESAYPAQLERRLQADGYAVEVINAGNSGETSSGALSRIDWVLNLQPDIVILATGGNDGLRGIDPSVTAENVDQLVGRIETSGAVVILAGMEMVQNMGAEYTSAFRALYPAIAERYDLILIPFFLEGVGGNRDLNQPDFIHPTAEGYTVVVETIYPYVVEALAQVAQRESEE
jgi:acyl-CoA thioesterase-1